ncbi:histidine kinase [Sorangium cellulosum]|uniref:histidine kinase n=1 Tax=Sorangium cellulosum TaxID=56 RepID=A0A2L0EK25_SORCE|nr:sensor histidine kinase [Sorangium cellulosum]AUX39651.1 histidine kinase [Sorangium cellulosum]
MSIHAKLAATFGVALTAVLLAGGAFYFTIVEMLIFQRRAEVSYEDLRLHVTLASDASRFMNEAVKAALRGSLGAELSAAAADTAGDLATIEALKRRMRVDEEIKESEAESAEEIEHVHSMQESFGRLVEGLEAISLTPHERASERQAAFVQLSDREYKGQFLPHIGAAVRDAERDVARILDDERKLRSKVAVLGAVAAGGALVVLIVLLGGLIRSIDRGFKTLLEGSRQLAQGHLDLRLPELDEHEFGRLSAAFNHMAFSLEIAQEARLRMEKLAAVGQLAASIGHDLRNPIGAVRNANHYLKKRLSGTELGAEPRVAQFLEITEKELMACSKIIGNLLDFARERRPLLSECSLRPLVDDAASVVEVPAHVRVENDVPDTLPVVQLDKDQLRQVLVNLIQNAAEAIPVEREGHVRVAAAWTSEGLTLSVADDGTGIPEETLPRIFEPLFSTKLKGTGLGLAISAGIVRRHGGTLEVTSEIGSGTTFVIRVPACDAPRATCPSTRPSGARGA